MNDGPGLDAFERMIAASFVEAAMERWLGGRSRSCVPRRLRPRQ
jgi:hypothetical protein